MKIQKTTTRNLFFLSFICLSIGLKAQVTIGSGLEPNKGTLLDLKERNPINPAVDNSTADKGLGMPRINLTSMTTLIDINGGTGKEIEHTGLTVYNLSTANGFEPGIYVWDGTKWILTKGSSLAPNINWLLTGNSGITEGSNFIGTTDLKDLSFKTNNTEIMRITKNGNIGIGKSNPSEKLDVAGKILSTDVEITNNLILTNTVTKSDATVLVIDNVTGQVGKASPVETISRMIYVQSGTSQSITGNNLTTLNAGNPVVVQWASTDIVENKGGLLNFNTTTYSFTFLQDALCEVSGYVNYVPSNAIPQNYDTNFNLFSAALNVSIQYSTNGGTSWIDLSTVRQVWTGASGGMLRTCAVPPAIRKFNKGELIRMTIKRPANNFGIEHGGGGTPLINRPTGSQFSKGLKITTL